MEESKIGAAILGFYAGIKICRREGYDPRDLFELMNDDERVASIIGTNPYEPTGKEPTHADTEG